VIPETLNSVEAIMNLMAKVVHSDPEIMGGTPVFVGTRVPVSTLFDYVESKEGIEDFLEEFPTVSREQAVAALGIAKDLLERHACTT
jgi:uncharacterized protein (DUF433 family)